MYIARLRYHHDLVSLRAGKLIVLGALSRTKAIGDNAGACHHACSSIAILRCLPYRISGSPKAAPHHSGYAVHVGWMYGAA